MKFPLLNIYKLESDDNDWEDCILFDEYIYSKDEYYFNTFLNNKLCCDCNGEIFKIKDKISPREWWRKTFSFIPMVYQTELVFEETGEEMEIETLRKMMMTRVAELPEDESTIKWLEDLKTAETIEQMIIGE